MRRRRAFTLIECLVGLAVGLIVVGLAWGVFSISMRLRWNADAKMQGVKAALLFIEPFQLDVRRLYMDPAHGVRVDDADGRRTLELYVYDAQRAELERATVRVRRVRYLFVPAEFAIYRQEEDELPRRIGGAFVDLSARLVPPRLRTPEGAPGSGGLLSWSVTAIPGELAERPRALWKAHEPTTVRGSLPLSPLNGRFKYDFWAGSSTSRATTGPGG